LKNKASDGADGSDANFYTLTGKGGNGQAGLSDRTIEELAERVLHHAADHVGDADLTPATHCILRRWLAEAGVLPGHIEAEAARVMDAVFRT
jgi:hypothetical protein